MAIRPPRRTVNRTTDAASSALRSPSATAGEAVALAAATPSAGEDAGDAQKQAVIEAFEASLRAQPGLEGEDLDFVLDHLRKRVAEVQLQPELTGPDRNAWVETLETLAQNGMLAEEESEALIRSFGEATSSLQGRDVQIALELARRIERDGEDKAMEWLASQEFGDAGAGTGNGLAKGSTDLVDRQSITRSRSRRLRGPPRAV